MFKLGRWASAAAFSSMKAAGNHVVRSRLSQMRAQALRYPRSQRFSCHPHRATRAAFCPGESSRANTAHCAMASWREERRLDSRPGSMRKPRQLHLRVGAPEELSTPSFRPGGAPGSPGAVNAGWPAAPNAFGHRSARRQAPPHQIPRARPARLKCRLSPRNRRRHGGTGPTGTKSRKRRACVVTESDDRAATVSPNHAGFARKRQ